MSEENFDRIQLLMSIPFEEMTPEDQAWVLREFGSQEAFESMVELMGPDELPEDPSPELEANVLREFDAFHAKSKKAAFPWTRVAAAIAFLVVGGWFLVYVLDDPQEEKAIAELNKSAADETEETSEVEDSQEKDSLPQLAELKEKKQQTIQPEIESPQIEEIAEDEVEAEMDMSEPKEVIIENFEMADTMDEAPSVEEIEDLEANQLDMVEVEEEADSPAEPASTMVISQSKAYAQTDSGTDESIVSTRGANTRATNSNAESASEITLSAVESTSKKSRRQQSIDLTVKLPKNHYRAY